MFIYLHEYYSAPIKSGEEDDDKSIMDIYSGAIEFKKNYKGEKSTVKFDDVLGIDEYKEELMEIVNYLKSPQKFEEMGATLPRGILLSGPPGTGKTMLAKAIAGEAGCGFFYMSGSQFEQKYVCS